uniref:Uncharacterized protein n=1 Tax=Anguilla anguilla TaxID=7936 RepID=A0A0E9SEY5_ANGAN
MNAKCQGCQGVSFNAYIFISEPSESSLMLSLATCVTLLTMGLPLALTF